MLIAPCIIDISYFSYWRSVWRVIIVAAMFSRAAIFSSVAIVAIFSRVATAGGFGAMLRSRDRSKKLRYHAKQLLFVATLFLDTKGCVMNHSIPGS